LYRVVAKLCAKTYTCICREYAGLGLVSKNLKNRKNFTNMFLSLIDWLCFKFHAIWVPFDTQTLLNFGPLKISCNFDDLWWCIKWHSNCMKFEKQSIYSVKNMSVKDFLLRLFLVLFEDWLSWLSKFLVVKGSSP
jgi:hypothetical protein